MASGFPVPLFLFAKDNYKEIERYEIIDGLQRLNAVFGYVENEYPLENGKFFDLSSTALTKELLDKGILQQNEVMEYQCWIDSLNNHVAMIIEDREARTKKKIMIKNQLKNQS